MSHFAALADHCEHLRLRGHTDASIYSRRRAVIRLDKWLRLNRRTGILDASRKDLQAWRAALTVSPDVVVAYVSHTREFYRWASAAGLRRDNPAADLPTPRLRRRVPRPIGDDDLLYAVGTAPPRVRPWLVLAGWAGLRAQEIALLRREHVLDKAQPPVLLVADGAGKGGTERIVPLSEYVLAELRLYGLPARGWVFRRRDGQRGPNRNWLISMLANRHLHACDVEESLHALRHRFATQTYQSSRDLRLVQDLLGHASPSTTAGYAAYDRAGAADAVDALATPRRLRSVK